MMKTFTKLLFSSTLLMLFLLTSVSAQELTKNYDESFDVDANVKVDLTNEFGQVNVETWDKNQVTINVEVRVEGKDEKESQKILDKINVKISGSNSLVKATTSIEGKLNCKNCEMSINYEVMMPASGMLGIRNDFGNVNVGDLDGSADLHIEYGNLEVGKLSGKENDIEIKFGNAEIDMLKAADLHIEYGKLEVGKAGYLDLYSRFNDLELGEVSELKLDSQYDEIEIGSGDVIDIDAAFSGVEIGEVFDKLSLTNSYSGIEVMRIAGGFSEVYIKNSFASVEIGVSSSASYKLEAEASYGNIDFPKKNADIIKHVDKDFEEEIEAFIGDDKQSASVIRVKVQNANIDIN